MYCFEPTILLKIFIWSRQSPDSCQLHRLVRIYHLCLFCGFDIVDQSVLLEAVPSGFLSLFWPSIFPPAHGYVMPRYHSGPCTLLVSEWTFSASPRLFFNFYSEMQPLAPGSALKSSVFHISLLWWDCSPLGCHLSLERANPQVLIIGSECLPPPQFVSE